MAFKMTFNGETVVHDKPVEFCKVCDKFKSDDKPCDCQEHDPWDYHQGTDGDL